MANAKVTIDTLPYGWTNCSLSDCVDIWDSKRVPVNHVERSKRKGNIPYYGATGQVGWIDDYLFDEELLLLGEDGAPFFDRTKHIAYIISGKSWVNNHAHVLRTIIELTSNTFLKHYLNQFDFTGYVSGTTRLKLNQRSMKTIPILVPPLNEQRRIVAKLEKLLQKVDACKERLDKIPAILKRFRQSILAAACSGRLTEDWREKNPNIESSIDHLKSLLKTRKREVKFDSHEIHNWTSTQVKRVYDSFGGGTPSKNRTEFWNGAIPWVSSRDVKADKIEQGTYFITQEGLEKSSASMCLEHSIIVVVRSGVLKHVLPVAVVQKPLAINQDIKCFDSTDKHLNYWLLLNLKAYQNEILKLNREGTTVQSVKYDTLKNFRINIPPTAEQQEIVRRVEALFKIADQIEERYHKARTYVDKLTQSILAKAFRGELVPQDPNDEPASELLKRIKA